MTLLTWGPKRPKTEEELFYQDRETCFYDGPGGALKWKWIFTYSSPYEIGPFIRLVRSELMTNEVFRCDRLIVRRRRTIIDYDIPFEMYAISPSTGEQYISPTGEPVWGTTTKDVETDITEQWEEVKRGKWIHTTSAKTDHWYFYKPGLLAFQWLNRPDYNQETDDQPAPQPEYRPSPWDFESQERQSELVRSPGRLGTRTRRVMLPYPTGATRRGTVFDPCAPAADIAADCEVHLSNWATLWDKLLNNQSRSRRFIVPYSDKIRQNYRPFQVFTAEHMASDGAIVTAKYMVNGFSLSLSPTECLCLIDGIWLEDIGD